MNNQSNTYQGINVEHLFANSIFDHPDAWNRILESIGYNEAIGATTPIIEVVGGSKRKTDVVIDFKNDRDLAPIRVSIKSFSDAGYNHIERRPLPDFCQRNQISKPYYNFLEHLWLRKAKNSKTAKLVEQNEEAQVRNIFRAIEPGISAVLGNDYPQILALYSNDLRKWHLYNMDKQVTPLIRTKVISFTARSSNIQIGDYVVIQRKGSAAGESGTDPNHISHGSNHVQIKMWVKKFFDRVEPVSWYQL